MQTVYTFYLKFIKSNDKLQLCKNQISTDEIKIEVIDDNFGNNIEEINVNDILGQVVPIVDAERKTVLRTYQHTRSNKQTTTAKKSSTLKGN